MNMEDYFYEELSSSNFPVRISPKWIKCSNKTFQPEVTKYIGQIYDVAVKIYPVTASGNGGNGCPSPASISVDAGNQQN